jgi:hypothetical protein
MSKLVEHCWAQDPEKRPYFREIYQTLQEIVVEIVFCVFLKN